MGGHHDGTGGRRRGNDASDMRDRAAGGGPAVPGDDDGGAGSSRLRERSFRNRRRSQRARCTGHAKRRSPQGSRGCRAARAEVRTFQRRWSRRYRRTVFGAMSNCLAISRAISRMEQPALAFHKSLSLFPSLTSSTHHLHGFSVDDALSLRWVNSMLAISLIFTLALTVRFSAATNQRVDPPARSNLTPPFTQALGNSDQVPGVHVNLPSSSFHSDFSTNDCMGIPGNPSCSDWRHRRPDRPRVHPASS